MKKALTILIAATALWFIGATQWYVCNIQYLCASSPSPVVGAPNNSAATSVIERVFGIGRDGLLPDSAATTQAFEPQTIHFAPDAAIVIDESEQANAVSAVQSYASVYPEASFMITGYTADVGTPCTDCEELSQMRAQTVRDALIQAGVDESRLITQSMALENPVADNTTSEGQASNRRVQITLIQ